MIDANEVYGYRHGSIEDVKQSWEYSQRFGTIEDSSLVTLRHHETITEQGLMLDVAESKRTEIKRSFNKKQHSKKAALKRSNRNKAVNQFRHLIEGLNDE